MPRTPGLTHRISHRGAVAPWVFVLMFAACGGDSRSPMATEESVASVTVAPVANTVVIGGTVRLTATANDAAGNRLTGRQVTWSSSNTDIALVTAGIVTGVADGLSTITATAEGKSGTASVTVKALVFASVSAGGYHTCGVTTDGTTYCWGRNEDGQLGNDDVDLLSRATPDLVACGLIFGSVDAGLTHSCGLTTDGTAYCWGGNFGGQLGNGTTIDAGTPVAVSGALSFALVSAGRSHTCALTTEGTGYCWGGNGDGKLGNGSLADISVPVAVSGGLILSSVSTGGFHTCGLTTDATAYCWGGNSDGQVGDGSTTNRTTPVLVLGQQ